MRIPLRGDVHSCPTLLRLGHRRAGGHLVKFRLSFLPTVALALAALGATASPAAASAPHSFVSPSLMATAQSSPNTRLRVIVQGSSTAAAELAVVTAGG